MGRNLLKQYSFQCRIGCFEAPISHFDLQWILSLMFLWKIIFGLINISLDKSGFWSSWNYTIFMTVSYFTVKPFNLFLEICLKVYFIMWESSYCHCYKFFSVYLKYNFLLFSILFSVLGIEPRTLYMLSKCCGVLSDSSATNLKGDR